MVHSEDNEGDADGLDEEDGDDDEDDEDDDEGDESAEGGDDEDQDDQEEEGMDEATAAQGDALQGEQSVCLGCGTSLLTATSTGDESK